MADEHEPREYVPPGRARQRQRTAAERAERAAYLERLRAANIQPPVEAELLAMSEVELDDLERRIDKKVRRA